MEYDIAKVHELVGLYRAYFILTEVLADESHRVIGVGNPESISGMEACMNAIKDAINTEHKAISPKFVAHAMFIAQETDREDFPLRRVKDADTLGAHPR